jgi:hypothetical protein
MVSAANVVNSEQTSERSIASDLSFAHHRVSMNMRSRLKAWGISLFGVLLALAGVALVLQLAALLLWQYGIALETRAWPRLPAGLVFADHSQLAASKAAPFLPFIPEFQWAWLSDPGNSSGAHTVAAWLLDKLHVGLLPALVGVLLALAGGSIVLRQRDVLAAAKRRNQDRLRRVGQYRNEQQDPSIERATIRAEPYLVDVADKAWRQERAKGRQSYY